MTFEQFKKHCEHNGSCNCCIYPCKNSEECYKLYMSIKKRCDIIKLNSTYGVIRKEIKDNGK